jgi:alanine-glyoxylate transaminase/serine-glyoxylate transaminase/serine-pyruvate transaminase
MAYGLWEGLRLALDEGLEARWSRHQDVGDFLQSELTEMGFELFAREGYRLPQLTSVRLPAGVGDGLRSRLLQEYDIEIGGGLGEGAGKVWRIGLMGHGATRDNALLLIKALQELI